jgi:hypothetical protein
MGNRKRHILTIILILAMLLTAVSTSQPRVPDIEIEGRISYEIRGEYFLIKIKTVMDPSNYVFLKPTKRGDSSLLILTVEGRREFQYFSADSEGRYKTVIDLRGAGGIREEKMLDNEDFVTFSEDEHFVIGIKNELIVFKSPIVNIIRLYDKDRYYHYETYMD